MPNIKISELPQVTSLAATDLVPSVSNSITSKITFKNFVDSLSIVSSSISASYSQTASYSLTASYVRNSISSSYPITVSGSTIYSVSPASVVPSGDSLIGSILLGKDAGFSISAQYVNYVIHMGTEAGYQALKANGSIFIGSYAGKNATSASAGTFIGIGAGQDSTKAQASTFLGLDAGGAATNASQSFFVGQNTGRYATNAHNSNFFGRAAGNNASSASYSTLIGYQVGYNVGDLDTPSIGSNNIIIGTNITLEDGRKDSINLGSVIFATGSYSTPTGNPFSGSMTSAKVGINQSLPEYTLDVSGSFRVKDGIAILSQVSMSLDFASDAAAASGGVPLGGLYRNGNVIAIRIS